MTKFSNNSKLIGVVKMNIQQKMFTKEYIWCQVTEKVSVKLNSMFIKTKLFVWRKLILISNIQWYDMNYEKGFRCKVKNFYSVLSNYQKKPSNM